MEHFPSPNVFLLGGDMVSEVSANNHKFRKELFTPISNVASGGGGIFLQTFLVLSGCTYVFYCEKGTSFLGLW